MIGFAIALLLVFTSAAGGTVFLPAELNDVVDGSQTIVRGRVVDVRSEMTAARRSIHSFVTLAVEERLKGSAGETVVFRIPIGQVGRYKRIIVGAPEFKVGDDVFVFLRGTGPAVPTLFGLSQGVYRTNGRAPALVQSFRQEVRRIVEGAR